MVPVETYNIGCKEFNHLIDIVLKTIKVQESIFDNVNKSLLDNLNNIKRKKLIKDNHESLKIIKKIKTLKLMS